MNPEAQSPEVSQAIDAARYDERAKVRAAVSEIEADRRREQAEVARLTKELAEERESSSAKARAALFAQKIDELTRQLSTERDLRIAGDNVIISGLRNERDILQRKLAETEVRCKHWSETKDTLAQRVAELEAELKEETEHKWRMTEGFAEMNIQRDEALARCEKLEKALAKIISASDGRYVISVSAGALNQTPE